MKSLYGTRKASHIWETKGQRVIIDSGFVIGTWSPAIVCCRERELWGFVHGDDFTITGHSMQLAWIESRLNEVVQGQLLQVWQDRSHVEGIQILRNECIRSWRRVGRDRMHRNGKRRFERTGDWSSAVAGGGVTEFILEFIRVLQ